MRTRQADRGRIGLGTLVLFLTMTLVASVAAGVLINTTGALGAAEEDTGASEADPVLVIGQTGTAIEDGSVGVVNLTVTVGPGAEPIDLREARVTWVGPEGGYTLRSERAPRRAPSSEPFRVRAVTDPSGSAPVLDEAADRFVLTVDLGETDDSPAVGEFGTRLAPGETVKVTITTDAGASTTTRLAVPDSLDGRSVVVL